MLEAYHIPGCSKLQADSLSRQYEKNLVWKLHPTVFKWVCQIFVRAKYRLVCITPQLSNQCLSFLVPRSRSLGRRCLFFLLEGIQTLYFPSFLFVRQNPNEAQGGGSFRCSNHGSLVANSTLVSTSSSVISPASYPSASVGQAPNFALGRFSSPSQRCNASGQRNFSKGSQLCAQVMASRDGKAVFRGLEMFFLLVW